MGAGERVEAVGDDKSCQIATAIQLAPSRSSSLTPSEISNQESEMFALLRADRGLAALVLCVALSGCATVTPIPYSEMASSSYLAPNPSDPSGRIPYRYSTDVDWRSYNKVMLDPVVIYRGP